MSSRHVASCGIVCAVLALAGCDQGRQPLEKVDVRVANAAPSFAELGFRREQDERNLSSLQFKAASNFAYDADTYDFFVFERSFPSSPGRSWSFTPTLEAGNGYTMVLVENAGHIEPVVLAHGPTPSGSAQIEAVHAANGLPALDLYLEAPGVGIGGATPRGTISTTSALSATAVPNGDYELWLTEAGNPANVLLASGTVNIPAADTTTIVVAPEGNQGTASISAMVFSTALSVVYDRNATNEIRVINGAPDQAPRDVAVNGEFSPPLFTGVAFAAPTAYAQTPTVGTMALNVTPAGNPGVLEIDQSFTAFAAGRQTVLFGGTTGTLSHSVVVDDGRRFRNEAKLRFFNAASQFSALNFVIANPGQDPTLIVPASTLAGPAGSGTYLPLAAGDYEISFLTAGTSTVVSGPTPVTLAAGGIYSVLAIDGPDTATAGIVLLDDFQ